MKFKFLHIIILVIVFTACKNNNKLTLESSNDRLVTVNGILQYNKALFTGRLVSYYNEKKLKTEIFFTDGKKNGTEKHWFENGSLAIERFYENGFKVGLHKAWWENGNPKFEYHFNDKGEFHGDLKEWYQTGAILKDFNYKNGKEFGSQRLWKLNGSIKANYEVVSGDRFGLIGLKKCYKVTSDSNEVK